MATGDWSTLADAVLLPEGQVAIGWETLVAKSGGGFDRAVFLTTRSAAGALSTQRMSAVGKDASEMDLAANGRGDMVISWENNEGIWARYRVASLDAWTGVWWVRQNSSTSVWNVRDSSAGIDDAGRATIVWREGTCGSSSGGTCSLFASSRNMSTGSWSAPSAALATSTSDLLRSNLSVGASGEMVVVWRGNTAPWAVFVRTKTATGSWSAPIQLATDAADPAATVAATGEISVVWRDFAQREIRTTSRRPGAAWAAPVTLAKGQEPVTIAAGPDGSLTAGWTSRDDGTTGVRTRDASGAWSAAQTLNGESRRQAVATASSGRASIAWVDASSHDLRVADYSAAAPALSDIGVPATLTVGKAGAFRASATSWLPGVAVSWDFGDGTVTTGASAEHSYAAAGTYSVIVRATDASGEVSTQLRNVVVSGGTVGGSTAPQLRKFKVKRHKIARVGSKSARAKRTRVIVKLSQKAEVRFVVKRVRKSGKARKVGAFTKRLDRGKSRFWLKAKAGKRVLKPGRYVIVARAKNADGRSAAKKQRLTVLR
ncbi:MAG: PKD domain-containing protein [Nocardioides sp.]